MATDPIKTLDLRRTPKPASGTGIYPVQKASGSRTGQMSKWLVNKLNRFSERQEREIVSDRSMDVVYNDPHAASTIDSMAVNITGTGLIPQANLRVCHDIIFSLMHLTFGPSLAALQSQNPRRRMTTPAVLFNQPGQI